MTVPSGSGIVLRDPLPWPEARQVVETAEQTGHVAAFVPEIEAREAFATLSGFAAATERLLLGTGVVTIWSRTPAVAAMAAATVHDLSGGRMILGIGAGSAAGRRSSRSGEMLPGPLALVEEYVRAVRAAFAGEPVRSDLFDVPGFRLGLSTETPPPVWLAALGDRMLALAGRVADGALLNWCTPERVADAAGIVRRSAEEAGRDPASVAVAVYVRACLGQEDEHALPPLRAMTGMYASFPAYHRQMALMGLRAEATAAAAAVRAGRPDEVPEALVRTLIVTGGRDEARARLDAYREAGADLVLCYPVPALGDPFSSILGTIMAAAPSPAVER